MIVLDTDHLNVLAVPGPRAERLRQKLATSLDDDFAITIVSVEEQMRGWLAEIKRQTKASQQVRPYERLERLVGFWNLWHLLPFDESAAAEFEDLLRQVRVGSQDLKIAAIARVHGAMVLTANQRDFERIPGTVFQNWLD